jgi:hypothetical protein
VTDPHKWVIHGERLVDDTPHIRVSLADVELPNHVRFTQYVFRMRRCAMTVVLDDAGERVLMMRRHRFIVDRWVWERGAVFGSCGHCGRHVAWLDRSALCYDYDPAHRISQMHCCAGLCPGAHESSEWCLYWAARRAFPAR